MYKIIWGNKAIIIYVQNNTDDLSKDIWCLWDWGVDVVQVVIIILHWWIQLVENDDDDVDVDDEILKTILYLVKEVYTDK